MGSPQDEIMVRDVIACTWVILVYSTKFLYVQIISIVCLMLTRLLMLGFAFHRCHVLSPLLYCTVLCLRRKRRNWFDLVESQRGACFDTPCAYGLVVLCVIRCLCGEWHRKKKEKRRTKQRRPPTKLRNRESC